ncbi:hypothetical protein ACFVJ4_36545 [Streptomyces sp. NPDC127178]|uniref:hypothetical protein n=1 Tax=unclassified Streptomyces TaxID=2593676 RepID=UPI00362D298F
MDITNTSEAAAGNPTENEMSVSFEDGDEITDAAQANEESAGEPATGRRTGTAVGAAAVVCVGLGLASITGTWVGTVLSERQRLIGQINSSTDGPAQQIERIFGATWHTIAAVNGAFALAAVLLAAVVLIGARSAVPWVRIAAWGGLALGVLGLLIAGGIWFDLFIGLPQVPAMPQPGG